MKDDINILREGLDIHSFERFQGEKIPETVSYKIAHASWQTPVALHM